MRLRKGGFEIRFSRWARLIGGSMLGESEPSCSNLLLFLLSLSSSLSSNLIFRNRTEMGGSSNDVDEVADEAAAAAIRSPLVITTGGGMAYESIHVMRLAGASLAFLDFMRKL